VIPPVVFVGSMNRTPTKSVCKQHRMYSFARTYASKGYLGGARHLPEQTCLLSNICFLNGMNLAPPHT
jgi:hypothetical protein